MSDQPHNPNKPNSNPRLSEISHLFLSQLRDKQPNGTARPQRTPPNGANGANGTNGQHTPPMQYLPPISADSLDEPNSTVDLTPEELDHVLGVSSDRNELGGDREPTHRAPVSALLTSHLAADAQRYARSYAAHLASEAGRIGLIECDGSTLAITLFERALGVPPVVDTEAHQHPQPIDTRRIIETLDELDWDVDRWLLSLPLRSNEARTALRLSDLWTLLSTSDHDGVVSAYRTLKGLADAHRPAAAAGVIEQLPSLSVALLDSRDSQQNERVARKIVGVCRQFLSWPIEVEPAVRRVGNVAEHAILVGDATQGTAQQPSAPAGAAEAMWVVLNAFLARPTRSLDADDHDNGHDVLNDFQRARVVEAERAQDAAVRAAQFEAHANAGSHAREPEAARSFASTEPIPMMPKNLAPETQPSVRIAAASSSEVSDVLELPEGASDAASIVAAVLRSGADGRLIATPISAPNCPGVVAVDRERRLVLVAVASQGLSDLRDIGLAYQWAVQNRQLISMALPQFAVNALAMPRVELLLDQTDLQVNDLQPILGGGNVTVMAYRKLRWAGRTGLLLDAA